jgi:hypothetical protein
VIWLQVFLSSFYLFIIFVGLSKKCIFHFLFSFVYDKRFPVTVFLPHFFLYFLRKVSVCMNDGIDNVKILIFVYFT